MENTLQHIFSTDYNQDAFFSGVLHYVFGEGNITRQEYPEEFIASDADRNLAENANILSIKKIGSIEGFFDDFSIFDIILGDNSKIAYSRVNIQKVLRKKLRGENSFLIFHYSNPEGKEWRLSYLYSYGKDSTDSKRYTYLLGSQHNARTVTERFTKLKNDLVFLKDDTTKGKDLLEEAFSVEALSNEFFDKYRALYANFVQYITGNRVVKSGSKWEEKKQHDPDQTLYAAFGKDDKRIRDYVKKLMGRITFLYFVQKKGWFNNDYNYLQHLFENCKYQDDFLDRVLEPFFYTVLNTEGPNRVKAFDDHNNNLRPSEVEWDTDLLKDWGNFPFLNGGLFERDENDIVRSQFPPQFFENLNGYDENFVSKIPQKDAGYSWERIPGIFDLFSQYNFTIDENDPDDAEVGIDPEMLGKIFENLLEDNKDKGAFYTPKEIVQYMCRESLIAYLQTDAKDDAHKERLRNFVTTHDASVLENPEYVRRKIKDIKVCDPAIGSGAFPMGMLNELVSCSEALDMHIDKNSNRAEIKKHIIQNSIYGVDIERGAVDIARLRFWLSLVIDEENAVPLPNLDYKIMQGNSLLEQYEGIDLSKLQINVKRTTVYEPQKDLFGRISDGQLKMTFTQDTTVNNLQQLLKDYFYETNHREKTKLKKEITKIVNDHIHYNIELRKTQVNRLIGEDEVFIRAQENKIADLQTQFQNQKLSPTLTAKFDAEIQKARRRIADNEAQLQKYDNALAEMLKEDFLSSNQQFFLWHTWFADVFNRSSNQGFDVVIGNPPYKIVAREDNLKAIYDQSFTVAQGGKRNLYHLFFEKGIEINKTGGILSFITPDTYLSGNDTEKLREHFLNNIDIKIIVHYTERDKVFENVTQAVAIIIMQKKPHETDFCIMDGGKCHIIKYANLTKGNKYVFKSSDNIIDKMKLCKFSFNDICDGYKGDVNLGLKKSFFSNNISKNSLPLVRGIQISKYQYSPGTEYCAIAALSKNHTNKERIVFQEVANMGLSHRTKGTILKNVICGDSCNIIFSKNKDMDNRFILAVLNSKAVNYYFKFFNQTNHVPIGELKRIPFPAATAAQQAPIIALVDEILAMKKANPQDDTSAKEAEIDALVCDLYGLSEEERKIVGVV